MEDVKKSVPRSIRLKDAAGSRQMSRNRLVILAILLLAMPIWLICLLRHQYSSGYPIPLDKFINQAERVSIGDSYVEVESEIQMYSTRQKEDALVLYTLMPTSKTLWFFIPKVPYHIEVRYGDDWKVESVRVYDG